MADANRYLRERFIPDYNTTFGRAPADPTSACVPIGRADLDQILCHEEARVVARDNTVHLDGVVLQLDKQPGGGAARACASSCAAISPASTRCGGARAASVAIPPRAGLGRRAPGVPSARSPRPLRLLGQRRAGPIAPRPLRGVAATPSPLTSERTDHVSNASGQITCQRQATCRKRPPGFRNRALTGDRPSLRS